MSNIWNDLSKKGIISCLAPMEGVTDICFRQVIAKAGRPNLFFTEFTNVSSYASEKGRANALERLEVAPTDSPIIAQIWGKNPEHFAEITSALKELGFSGVDLNFGCPDRHVNNTGGGAAMIRTPELAIACFRNAVEHSNGLPVSIKTRLGYTYIDEYKDWLSALLREHPAALTIHLRTRKEMSKVPAHYELVPDIIHLKNELSPETKLLANGDILDYKQGEKMVRNNPGLDGYMIGRGIFQNPYCFTNYQPTREELIELLIAHLDFYDKKNKQSGNTKQRSFEPLKHYFKIYIKDFPGASEFRQKLMDCHSTSEVRDVINQSRY